MGSNHGGFGGLRFPAALVDAASALDPGHEALRGLLETAINSELGDAWQAVVAGLSDSQFLKRGVNIKPVNYTTTVETTDQQRTQFKAEWPVLSVYREGEPELFHMVNGYIHWKQRWSVDWVVGPIKAQHIPKLGRFAIAVGRVICRTIELERHPDFDSGFCQFFGQFSQIKAVAVAGPGVQRALTEDDGSGYYGLTVTLETLEREYDDTQFNVDHIYVGTDDAVPVETLDANYLTIHQENESDPPGD